MIHLTNYHSSNVPVTSQSEDSEVILIRPNIRIVYYCIHMWRFPETGVPNSWMVYKGKSSKMDDLGVPLFQETSIYIIYTYTKTRGCNWYKTRGISWLCFNLRMPAEVKPKL